MKVIPIKASAGIHGFESPAAEYTQLKLTLDDLLIEHPSSTFLGRACGDSMQQVGIFDDDILVVDRAITVQNQDVIVANINGEFVCKIIDMKARQLLSANAGYPPVVISDTDTFTIEGTVTRSVRCHRSTHLLDV